MKFHQTSSLSIRVMLRTKSKDQKQQRGITPLKEQAEWWFWCTALPLIKVYLHMKFHQHSYSSIRVMLQTKSKDQKQQRGITPLKEQAEWWFLCNALPIIKVYLHMKFHQHSYSSIGVMLRTNFCRPTARQTDRQTDRQGDSYIPPQISFVGV